MEKKILVCFVVLFAGICVGAYSFGIGLQFNGHASDVFSPGVALALSFTESTHLALNWYFGSVNNLGLTADYWAFTPGIFFLGAGLYASTLIGSDDFDLKGGIRFPLGISIKLAKFEIYAQVAPSIGLKFYPSLGGDRFFFPFALGGRFWF
ncbi:MAG: hypothetical protein LBP93_02180 [Treponema sp.]|jgi:hypothetical protein|nr:hypothetical protein [Treponema sp.]